MKDGTMKMRLKNQKGTSVVEFAIVLPLLVLLLFGIIEFSLLLFNKQVITNASREGARAGIVAQVPRVSDPAIRKVVSDYAKAHLVTFGSDTLVEDADHIPIVREDVNTDNPPNSFGDDLKVTVNYQYDFLVFPGIIVGLFSGNMGQTLPLRAVTVMRLE